VAERFVVLGLAHPRAEWLSELVRWSDSSAVPVEVVKCLSAEELEARLASGQAWSAALLDATVADLDRDLLGRARAAGCPALVVCAPGREAQWTSLGATACLPRRLDRQALLDALARHATPAASFPLPGADPDPGEPPAGPLAPVVAVCGPGGTGASTVAMALAQGLACGARRRRPGRRRAPADRSVVLADFCLRSEQAALHDAGDVVPGVQELAEAARLGNPSAEQVRQLTYWVVERRYHLLLGLRRPSHWADLRPRALEAGLAALRQAFDAVVADTDSDLEGEDAGGSADVQDRHLLARTAVGQARVVLAVGQPGLKGALSLARTLNELVAFGVRPASIVPVFNRVPRATRRGELTDALAELVEAPAEAGALAGVAFLPEAPVERALRLGLALPAPLVSAVCRAYMSASPAPARPDGGPQPVAPGELGHWAGPPGPGLEPAGAGR
jgi:hypothetical protein